MIPNIEGLIRLVEMVLVVTTVVAYLIVCTDWFREILDRNFSIKNRSFLILIFGILSIYGSYSGIEVNGAIINIRDLGPAAAGLIGGHMIGSMAGLIGAINRLFMGGWTSIPCSLATVFAGIFGGAAHRLKKGKLVNFREALVLGIGIG